MRVVLDTNVVVSGLFFGGVPGRILSGWNDGRITLVVSAPILAPERLAEPICVDPADDKFFACAAAAECRVIVSGDRHLIAASGWGGIEVLKPREFVERHLGE